MLWELFVLPKSCFVLCSFVDGVEPYCLTLRSRHFERFVSVVLGRCPCLRGPRLSHSSDRVFGFCLAFDHLFEFFVRFFSFSFFYELLTVCVVNALIKGEIEDQSV
jgi:hypothetical protein